MYLSLEEAACGSRRVAGCHGPCRVWLHDGSPARDVAGRDVVGGASEPAPLTAEHVPGRMVPLADVGSHLRRPGRRPVLLAGLTDDLAHAMTLAGAASVAATDGIAHHLPLLR